MSLRTSMGLACVATALVVACGDDGGSGDTGTGANSGTGANNGTGADNGTGAENGTGADSGTGAFGNLLGGSGGGGGGFQGCEGVEEEATLVPVNMFITFDRSGSMQSSNKWVDSTAALSAFFADPDAGGLRVALRFFPDNLPVAGCGCDFNACASMLVDLAPLTQAPAPMDTQEQALLDAIASTSPNGSNTPIYGALGGAVQAAEAHLAANPSEQAVVIFVSDGAPNGCDTNSNNIAGLAAAGLTNGVITYSIGLQGSNESLMNLIAQQGGSNQGIFIGNGNATAELLAALKAIQGNTVSCDFVVPEMASNGEVVDPTKVNVVYDDGSGMDETIPQVASLGDCGAAPGWYYDDPNDPTTLTLCPTFCGQVQQNENANINLQFGCVTMGPF